MSDSSALLTDHYEFTMLEAALRDGTAQRDCVFEVFTRRLPRDRAYAVVAGTGRLLDLVAAFRFGPQELAHLAGAGVVSEQTLEWLAGYRFTGDIDGYAEGEVFLPGSPILSVRGDFASAVLLETVVLAVLNHDVAVASAASRMWVQAGGRPLIEMGSRRTHEEAAVAAARAAYLAGFASTSNVEAGRRFGIPTAGTAAHAFTLLHDTEQEAFTSQVAALGTGTTLLVDTFDTLEGVRRALAVAGPGLGAVRIDSGDLAAVAREVRALLDAAGAHGTRIVATSDLDEYALAELADAPIDAYGVGTAVVTGSGSPAAGLVYKLVAVDGRPVAKRSGGGKDSRGGRKAGYRPLDAGGIATAEVVRQLATDQDPVGSGAPGERALTVPFVRGGQRVAVTPLGQARQRHERSVLELPEAARALRAAGPALTVRWG
ncbi:MAG TPA: nicotinate phosphoribosyltransferase [Candidatus Nanopelagicales bacterium]